MAASLALVCWRRDGFHDYYELKFLGKERSVKSDCRNQKFCTLNRKSEDTG
jgi:hypothetical protein